MKELSVAPYRVSDELETLRQENKELRDELESLQEELELLKGETLYEFRPQIGQGCRMCNTGTNREVKRVGSDKVIEFWGLELTFEPAIKKRWWRAARPMRLRRDCKQCGAVYYESPPED